MPLTFSHPAIVLPLNYLPKRWVSLTGLIAGSVAPDFEYFFRMKVYSIYSHTWLGLLWFDAPVALILAFVYHNLVKVPFITNLPQGLNSRFAAYLTFNWNKHWKQNAPVIILSVLIGGASHLLWDSFTHITGYFVEHFNLARPVKISSFQVPVYKIVQHLSTLLGSIVIIVAIYKLPSQSQTNLRPKKGPYWLIVVTSIFTTVLLKILFGLNVHQYWNILVTAISGGLLGIVFASVISRSKRAVQADNFAS